nr:MAG TPA: baseplate assembly protein V [Caudoviricetes sp.]
MSAEDQRKTANLIKQGNIAESDPAGRVRVRIGNLLTDWLPYFVPFAGGVSVHRPPSVGENCLVLSPSGETAAGLVLCGLMSDQFPQPSNSADETVIRFPDGASIRYNHAAGSLDASGIKTITVQAAQSLLIDCPQSSFTGALTVDGLFTYQAGMAGSNGQGGSTTINGDIRHGGGTLSSNGVVLDTHTHQGVTPGGGNTGEPVK